MVRVARFNRILLGASAQWNPPRRVRFKAPTYVQRRSDAGRDPHDRTNAGDMYGRAHRPRMHRFEGAPRAGTLLGGFPLGAAVARLPGETNLQLTNPLLWTLVAISTAGAIVTFAVLVYALWRFKDPSARRRRHG